MATYKPLLHKYIKEDGTSLIQIRITKFRTSVKLGTGYYIKKKDWNIKGSVRTTESLHEKYNRALAAIIKELQEIEIEADQEGKMYNASEIKQAYKDKRLRQILILYQDWIDSSPAKEITKKSYLQSKNNFKSFLGSNAVLLVQNVNLDVLQKYERYILAQNSNQGTANLYIGRLGSVMKRAVNKGIIPHSKNPFNEFEYSSHQTQSLFLPVHQIMTLAVAPLKKKSELYRDIYITQFLAGGMRVRDALLLQKNNIKGDYERIEYTMSKNGKVKSIPICSALKTIIQRWVSESRELIFPAVNPKLKLDREIKNRTTSMDVMLKVIARKININDKINTHSARHSFGKIAEDNTKDVRGLQEVYAHSNIETTLDYIEDKLELDKYDYIVTSVQDEFEKVGQLLNQIN